MNPPELPPPLTRRTSRYAIASLVLGLVSFVAGYIGVLTGLVSVMLGVLALGDVGPAGRLTGRNLAISGIILGGLASFLALTIYDWNALFHDTPERKSHLSGPAHWP